MIFPYLLGFGLLIKFVNWLTTPKVQPYSDAEWEADVAKAMYQLNLKEAAEMAKQDSRHIRVNQN
jgi:hypothetical protein